MKDDFLENIKDGVATYLDVTCPSRREEGKDSSISPDGDDHSPSEEYRARLDAISMTDDDMELIGKA